MDDTNGSRPKIAWGAAALAKASEQQQEQQHEKEPPSDRLSAAAAILQQEREKHEKRAARFNIEVKDPSRRPDLRQEARKQRVLSRRPEPDFLTGIDLFSEEELKRRKDRAARFRTQDTLAEYQPAVDLDEEQRRRARAQKFGVKYEPTDETGLADADLLEEKKSAPAFLQRRADAVHVYGVDLMSSANLLEYFTEYRPTFVEWINDSCCNVLFADQQAAKRAVFGMGKPLPPEDIPEGQSMETDDIGHMIEYLWHKGPDFDKDGTAVPLIFRIATVEDIKEITVNHRTRRLWVPDEQRNGSRRGGGRGGGREGLGSQRKRRYQGEEDAEMLDSDVRTVLLYSCRRPEQSQRAIKAPGWPSAVSQHDDRTSGPGSAPALNGSDAPHRKRGRRLQGSGLFSAAAAGIATEPRGRDAADIDRDDAEEDGGGRGGRDVVSYDDI